MGATTRGLEDDILKLDLNTGPSWRKNPRDGGLTYQLWKTQFELLYYFNFCIIVVCMMVWSNVDSLRTAIRLRPSPPNATCQDECDRQTGYRGRIWWGCTGFDVEKETEWTIREMTDVIGINQLNCQRQWVCSRRLRNGRAGVEEPCYPTLDSHLRVAILFKPLYYTMDSTLFFNSPFWYDIRH